MQGKRFQVLVMGDVLMDHQHWIKEIPRPGDDQEILFSESNLGGSGANTACGLAYLKVPVTFISRIGRDQTGQEILKAWDKIGLDYSFVEYGKRTGYTVTLIDQSGERTMFSYRGAVGEAFELSETEINQLREVKLFFISAYYLLQADRAKVAFQIAKEIKANGGVIALDPSPVIVNLKEEIKAEAFALTDLILPNRRELELITNESDLEKGLEILGDLIPGIALKLGSEGSRLRLQPNFLNRGNIKQENYFAKALQAEVIDTTGAGDAFNAGFLAGFLSITEPQAWLEKGNELASRVIAQKGATTLFFQA